MLGTMVVDRGHPASEDHEPARRPGAMLAILVLVSTAWLGLGLRQAWSDSLTYDEPVYISTGLTALVAHDVSLNPEHPPLWKAVAVLPVLFVHPVIPPGYRQLSERGYADRFVQAQRQAGKLRSVVFCARLIPLLEGVAIGLALLVLGRRLVGPAAGLLAAVLWWADPLSLGLAHLDSVDVAATLAVVALAWTMLGGLRDPSPRRLYLLGAAAGAVVLADDYGLVLAALAALVVALESWRARRSAAARTPGWWLRPPLQVLGAAWVTVLLSYAVLDPGSLLPAIVVPRPFVDGLRYLAVHDTKPSEAYLLGVSWQGGRWWYWPVSLVVKLPWSTLVIMLLGLLGYRQVPRATRRDLLVVAAIPAAVITAVLLLIGRQIGLRYALPVVALLALIAAPVAESALAAWTRRRWGIVGGWLSAGLLLGLVGLSAAETVASAPHSLSWVSPGLGPSYQVVTNSSGDWGQDFSALQRWAVGKTPLVAYFGTGASAAEVPDARPLLVDASGSTVSVDPRTIHGWVAASASELTSAHPDQLGWLRAYCPVGNLGGTILLYRFAAAPEALRGPTTPASPCRGPLSTAAGPGR